MIANYLSTIMGKQRVTKAELQRRTGLGVNTIRRVYNGESKQIDLEVLFKVCKALDVSPGDILKMEDDPT